MSLCVELKPLAGESFPEEQIATLVLIQLLRGFLFLYERLRWSLPGAESIREEKLYDRRCDSV